MIHLHTVDNLLKVDEIAALEITPDFGEDVRTHSPVMARILERKPLVVHGSMSLIAAKELMRRLPSRGLALFCRCDSPREAAELMDALGVH